MRITRQPGQFFAFVLVLLAHDAYAVPVTFEFEATVTKDWFPGVATSLVGVGDSFSGRFSYDSDAESGIRNSYNWLFYSQDVNLFGVEISLGAPGSFTEDQYVLPNGYKVAVRDGYPRSGAVDDWIHVQVSSEGLPVGGWPAGPRVVFQFTLRDYDGTAFASDALPTALDLAAFEDRQLRLGNAVFDSGEPRWMLDSQITSMRLIPEPSALVLVGLGIGLLSQRWPRNRPTRSCP